VIFGLTLSVIVEFDKIICCEKKKMVITIIIPIMPITGY
jgi:hypothetical protein